MSSLRSSARRVKLSSRRLVFEPLESRTLLATVASFDNDRASAAYAVSKEGSDPGPVEIAGGVIPGSAAEYLRLYSGVTNDLNSVSFGRTDSGAFGQIIADFDFRLTAVEGRPDGLAFVLLNTANYGINGPAPAGGSEPRYAGSLGIGFD